MSLTLALNNALTSLKVNQRTMAVISNNIANANTEGYSRQVVDLASVEIDGTGAGVRIEDIVRKVDEYLLATTYRQTSSVGKADVINDFMERSQILLGDPGNQTGIDAQIETFFNNLQSMAETPERTSTRASVVESAVNLAREVSSLADGIQTLRFRADTEIAEGVDDINNQLKKMAHLNEAIAHADAFGTSKATLFDQRDLALKKISEMMDVRTYQQENGVAHLYVGNGIPLLDESLYQISYDRINSVSTLLEDAEINPMMIYQVDSKTGVRTATRPLTLVGGGQSSEIIANFTNGRLAGLLELRDQTFTGMLEQVDMLASELRDQFNTVHNQGSGYPAASELTGTREIGVSERMAWSGAVQIAVLDIHGNPAPSAYADEDSDFRPLTLNLDTLYNGVTTGEPTTQVIINEINNHFGSPQPKLELGNFNQIQLALTSESMPTTTGFMSFDFDIENISGQYGDFWVSDVQILDDTATNITSVTDTMPAITLNTGNTFTTAAGSNLVTVATLGAHGLQIGDRVKLADPAVAVGGIAGASFDDYFVVQSVSSTGFVIQLPANATTTGTTSVAAQTAIPPYGTIDAGTKERVFANGSITANLGANTASSYYDVQVTMAVRQEDGTVANSVVNYRVLSPRPNTLNDRVSAQAVISGAAVIESSAASQGYLRAILVDAEGNELPTRDGEYGDQSGYLKLISLRPDEYNIAISELDSKQLGLPSDTPPRDGSNRGFSHFFELNNFFKSNQPIDTGDTVRNSALHMAVESRLREHPNWLSTGNLERSNQPADTTLDPLYTYERFSGDNSIAQQLAKLGVNAHDFGAAGGLSASTLTFNGYAGEMLGYMAALTTSASATLSDHSTLLKGYQERATAISGVNLDEELANTLIYQNAYSASAKMVSTTDELFKTLLGAF
jgi:flagellar hook-associated protein 1 FlgK